MVLGLAAPDPPPRAAGDLVRLAGLPPAGALVVARAGVVAGCRAGRRPPLAGPPALAPAAGLRRGGSDRDCGATGMHRLLARDPWVVNPAVPEVISGCELLTHGLAMLLF